MDTEPIEVHGSKGCHSVVFCFMPFMAVSVFIRQFLLYLHASRISLETSAFFIQVCTYI